jgi:uncharacterized membrane protein
LHRSGTFLADEFLAQVPPWMPAPELVVLLSGVVELVLGCALIFSPKKWLPIIGWVTAAFFLIIFPGKGHIRIFLLNPHQCR